MSLCPECFCDLQKEVHTESCTFVRDEGWLWQRPVTATCAAPPVLPDDAAAPDQIGPTRASVLPTDAAGRKTYPLATGLFDYFPDALCEVAHLSYESNEQHHPGTPVHWDRNKSTDEDDTLLRHFIQRGTRDTDGKRHTAKMVWRALALFQKELERERE